MLVEQSVRCRDPGEQDIGDVVGDGAGVERGIRVQIVQHGVDHPLVGDRQEVWIEAGAQMSVGLSPRDERSLTGV